MDGSRQIRSISLNRPLLKTGEVCKLLRIPIGRLYEMLKTGELPAIPRESCTGSFWRM